MTTRELNLENLDQTIDSDGIVFVDFWAEWCGPCRAFAPVFEQASVTHSDIVFGKVDTQAQQEIAAGYGITSIPTLMAFRDGILVFAQAGALNSRQLDQVVEGVKGLDMDAVREQVRQEELSSRNDSGAGEL